MEEIEEGFYPVFNFKTLHCLPVRTRRQVILHFDFSILNLSEVSRFARCERTDSWKTTTLIGFRCTHSNVLSREVLIRRSC